MTLVDSYVILDLVTADKRWLEWSSGHLAEAADSGPVAINPVIFAECAYGYRDAADLLSDSPAGMQLLPLPYEAAFLAGKAFPGTGVWAEGVNESSAISTSAPTRRSKNSRC